VKTASRPVSLGAGRLLLSYGFTKNIELVHELSTSDHRA
jgi:hypothetical protein